MSQMALICLTLLQVVQPQLPICVNNDNCNEGYTCLNGTCTKCLTCSLLFRKGRSCITDFIECGDCLEGYEEISVTDFSTTIKACKPKQGNMKFKDCTSNNNCSPDSYCSDYSCVPCFDCGLVNRLPPANNCAKGLTECGSCTDGFSEAAVTYDTNYTRCEMESFAKQQTVVNFNVIAAVNLAAVFVFFIFLLIKILGRSKHKINSESNALPSTPRLQDEEAQQTVSQSHFCTHLTSANSIVLSEEQTQKATCEQPDASYFTKWKKMRVMHQLEKVIQTCNLHLGRRVPNHNNHQQICHLQP